MYCRSPKAPGFSVSKRIHASKVKIYGILMAGEFRLWMNLFLANFNPCRLTLMGSSNVETAVDSPSLN